MANKPVKTDRVDGNVKSLNNEQRAFVTFVNRTVRSVDVCWVNYQGILALYKTIKPGSFYHLNTFVTHPWIFKDHATGDRLCVAGQEIYYPAAWNGENERTKVHIDIPVFSLTVLCMQVLKRAIPCEEFSKLEIPVVLIDYLREKQNRPCPKRYVAGQTPQFVGHDQVLPEDQAGNDRD